MKKKNFDLNLLKDTLGLSCVENYVIYAFREQGWCADLLYCRSFLSFARIWNDFMEHKAKYAYYSGIPRIQKTAVENGVIDLAYSRSKWFPSEELFGNKELLVTVEPAFLIQNYGAASWREDHYIMVRGNGKEKVGYLNDVPPDIGELRHDVLKEAYSGEYILFCLKDKPDKKMEKEFLSEFIDHIRKEAGKTVLTEPIDSAEDIMTVRDILGVFKISRNRMKRYPSLYMDTSFMDRLLQKTNVGYGQCEYMRLRRKVDEDKVKGMIHELSDMDRKVQNKIKGLYRTLEKLGGKI